MFDDLELQVKIGQWADIITSTKISMYGGISVHPYLEASKLIKKTNIPKELLDKDGSWSLTSPSVSIKASSDGKISYTLTADSYEEFTKGIQNNPFIPISKGVEEVKRLSKSLVNRRKKS